MAQPPGVPPPSSSTGQYQDPTALTTAAVDKATVAITSAYEKDIQSLKDLVSSRFDSVSKEIGARDVAVKLLADDVKSISAKIQQEVASQQALLVEKMNVIKADMAGMKELATALKSAADAGINAAFLAADKVVQSQYMAFKDTLDKTSDSVVLRIIGIEHQLEIMRDENRLQSSDIKDRVTRLETRNNSISETRTESHANIGSFTSVGLWVIAAAALLISMYTMSQHNLTQPVQQPAAIAVAPLAPSALRQ